jgi:small conductance mechanosensitive channel
MARRGKRERERSRERMFETRSQAWAAVGLHVEVNRQAVRHARRRLAVTAPLMIATIVAQALAIARLDDRHGRGWHWLVSLGSTPVRTVAVLLVVSLGWLISIDLSRVAPTLFRRMEPGAAGTVGFLIRLVSVAATATTALAVGGISSSTIALGGAFTAVVLGLAAQQTLGNVFAGIVLLSARPFRVGERVRLQAGVVAGQIEGTVSNLGLLYTTLARGDDRIMIPNNVVLAAAVVPLREPEAVDVKVRLAGGVTPSQLQAVLDAQVAVATRSAPSVVLEEIDGDAVVVRIRATPEERNQGAKLADEIIAALQGLTGEHAKVD